MSPSEGEEGKAAAAVEGRGLTLLENDMIAVTGFCFHRVQNKAGFFLEVLYHPSLCLPPFLVYPFK